MLKLLIFVLLISCHSNQHDPILHSFFTFKDVKASLPSTDGEVITRPMNSWVRVFENEDSCFYYKTPFRKELGEIRITNKSSKCSYDSEIELRVEKVKGLTYKISHTNKDDLRLTLEFNDFKEEYKLINTQLKHTSKLLDNGLPRSFISSIYIDKKYPQQRNLKDKDLCHGVNSNCQNVVGYRCEKCPAGFYEVVDFNCSQGGSKYCGSDNCGKKNEPACPRGYKILGSKLKSLCFDGSPAGLCGPGLRTFCNEDNILICI